MAEIDGMVVDGPADIQEENIEEEKIIAEEYKVWKKNAPLMYQSCYTYA